MKTLISSILILFGVIVIVPRIISHNEKMEIPKEMMDTYIESPEIRKKKRDIQFLKVQAIISMEEAELRLKKRNKI